MRNDSKKFPTKKDMTYWILILIIIITVVSVWRTTDPSMLTNQLSLGGTLLSIFLAIIAIIFSFIQSSDANSHNKEMNEKMTALTDSLKYLNELNDEKTEKIAIKSSELEEIKKLIENITKEVTSVQEQAGNGQLNKEKLDMLAKKIEESQMSFSTNEFPVEINIYGPNTLYNFLIENYKKNEYVLFQTIRTKFNEASNMNISAEELMKTLKTLQSQNKVFLQTDNTGIFVKIK